ncbi:MAG: ferritin-like domain-containing protein [Acidobacteria bacterium]|nr:ferritin-like domain-containing protein [Acidobacteriota bacterium]MCA1651672.1 ferritin-like domain-containing protein [Acidobacteriota bacterium]
MTPSADGSSPAGPSAGVSRGARHGRRRRGVCPEHHRRRAFEDFGVSAYAGAAKLIDNANILEAAARIALTEGQHAGLFRYLIAVANTAVTPVDNKDVPPLGSPAGRLFQVDGNGLSTVRTASEVLKVSYGGASSGGGFFPNGVNGDITRA